ncbi:hypothetical protein B6U91_00565 [Candidatus Pacearchaeota archaeon ex4484_71]|nr:MAG: hypothetical protein B6U91_00565 [Candidatus Pacearchaeota archaeon ex4484_71]
MGLKELSDKIEKVEKKLGDLEAGKVLEVSDLSKDVAEDLAAHYRRDYFVMGPNVDNKSSAEGEDRYLILVAKYSGRDEKNA